MKIIDSIKSNKTKAHFIALLLYIIGSVLDVYGYIFLGMEVLAHLFLLGFIGYGSALAIIWYINNKKLLKAAKYHFMFLFIGIPIIFVSWANKIYPTFAYTIVFVCVIAVLFIINLCRICSAYYYDDWK